MATTERAAINGASRAEDNRAMVARIHKALGRLLALACSPDFRGSISVTVNSKDGVLAEPVATLTEHGAGK